MMTMTWYHVNADGKRQTFSGFTKLTENNVDDIKAFYHIVIAWWEDSHELYAVMDQQGMAELRRYYYDIHGIVPSFTIITA